MYMYGRLHIIIPGLDLELLFWGKGGGGEVGEGGGGKEGGRGEEGGGRGEGGRGEGRRGGGKGNYRGLEPPQNL